MMHFEVLVEDASTCKAVGTFLEKLIGPDGDRHSFRVHPYKGIGRVPPGLRPRTDAAKRILLDQLPRLLRGYGQSLKDNSAASVVVIVDCDDRDCLAFKEELLAVQAACYPCPRTLFRIAIEEGEAWLLGDPDAVLAAYPKANRRTLESYTPDTICGTWELLADAVFPGGSSDLSGRGGHEIGRAKYQWAQMITPHVDVNRNGSPSFRAFCDGIMRLAEGSPT